MIINYTGLGSYLFKSLDPNDNSLYIWDQSNNNLGFLQVSNAVIGNTSGTINVVSNAFNTTVNSFNYNVGGNTITVTKAKPPTVTILQCTNNYLNATGTYNPPTGVTWLKVRMVGGGGGGAAWNSSTNANTGNNTIFGNTQTIAVNCGGGNAGFSVRGGGEYPGFATVTTVGVSAANGWTVFSQNGAIGQGSFTPASTEYAPGGDGGSTPFGGGGGGGWHTAGGWGAVIGSGAGGGGSGGEPSVPGGGGGGSGAYAEIYITQVANSYPYQIGLGGAAQPTNLPQGGQNGGQGVESIGGDGGSGSILIEEYYGF